MPYSIRLFVVCATHRLSFSWLLSSRLELSDIEIIQTARADIGDPDSDDDGRGLTSSDPLLRALISYRYRRSGGWGRQHSQGESNKESVFKNRCICYYRSKVVLSPLSPSPLSISRRDQRKASSGLHQSDSRSIMELTSVQNKLSTNANHNNAYWIWIWGLTISVWLCDWYSSEQFYLGTLCSLLLRAKL